MSVEFDDGERCLWDGRHTIASAKDLTMGMDASTGSVGPSRILSDRRVISSSRESNGVYDLDMRDEQLLQQLVSDDHKARVWRCSWKG